MILLEDKTARNHCKKKNIVDGFTNAELIDTCIDIRTIATRDGLIEVFQCNRGMLSRSFHHYSNCT